MTSLEDIKNCLEVSGKNDLAVEKAGIDLPEEDPGYIDELEKLSGLKEKGIITEQEFEANNKQLMGV